MNSALHTDPSGERYAAVKTSEPAVTSAAGSTSVTESKTGQTTSAVPMATKGPPASGTVPAASMATGLSLERQASSVSMARSGPTSSGIAAAVPETTYLASGLPLWGQASPSVVSMATSSVSGHSGLRQALSNAGRLSVEAAATVSEQIVPSVSGHPAGAFDKTRGKSGQTSGVSGQTSGYSGQTSGTSHHTTGVSSHAFSDVGQTSSVSDFGEASGVHDWTSTTGASSSHTSSESSLSHRGTSAPWTSVLSRVPGISLKESRAPAPVGSQDPSLELSKELLASRTVIPKTSGVSVFSSVTAAVSCSGFAVSKHEPASPAADILEPGSSAEHPETVTGSRRSDSASSRQSSASALVIDVVVGDADDSNSLLSSSGGCSNHKKSETKSKLQLSEASEKRDPVASGSGSVKESLPLATKIKCEDHGVWGFDESSCESLPDIEFISKPTPQVKQEKRESPQPLETKNNVSSPERTSTPGTQREAASTPLLDSQNSVASDGSDLPDISDIFSLSGTPEKGNSALKKLESSSAVVFTCAGGSGFAPGIGLTSVADMNCSIKETPVDLSLKKRSLNSKRMSSKKAGSQLPQKKSAWNQSTSHGSEEFWPSYHGESLPTISPPKRKQSASPCAEDERQSSAKKLLSASSSCLNSGSCSQHLSNSGGVKYLGKKSPYGSSTTVCTVLSTPLSKNSDSVPLAVGEDLRAELNAPLQFKRGTSKPSASATSESIPDTRSDFQKRMDDIDADLLRLNRFMGTTLSMSADFESDARSGLNLKTVPSSSTSLLFSALLGRCGTHPSIPSLNRPIVTSAASTSTSTVTAAHSVFGPDPNEVELPPGAALRKSLKTYSRAAHSRAPKPSQFSTVLGQSHQTAKPAKPVIEPSTFKSQPTANLLAKPSNSTSELSATLTADSVTDPYKLTSLSADSAFAKKKKKKGMAFAEGEVSRTHQLPLPSSGFGSVTTAHSHTHSSSTSSSFGAQSKSVNSPVSHSHWPLASRPGVLAGLDALGRTPAGPLPSANLAKQPRPELPGSVIDLASGANSFLPDPVIDVDAVPVLLDDRYAMLLGVGGLVCVCGGGVQAGGGGGGGSSVETVFWNVCSIKYMYCEVGNGMWTNYDHWTIEQRTSDHEDKIMSCSCVSCCLKSQFQFQLGWYVCW